MQLTKEQLSPLMIGTLDVTEQDGWFSFSRFSEKQKQYYQEKDVKLYKKTGASAGIRLDMITDADRLSFDFRIQDTCGRPFYSLDFYIDNLFYQTFFVRYYSLKYGDSLSFDLPKGTHRVTLYLPNLMKTELSRIQLENATFVKPIQTDRKLLFFGDSITQGYNAYRTSLSYTNRLARALNADICNQAIGSEIFDANMIDPNLSFSPDLIVTAYGTNDWIVQKTNEQFLGAAEAFFARLQAIYPDRPRVYISPIWRGYTEGVELTTGTFAQASQNLRQLAEAYGFFVVDGLHLVLHDAEYYEDKDMILHPNDLGFSIYAENLLAALKPLLETL